jgi:hypothetical protein
MLSLNSYFRRFRSTLPSFNLKLENFSGQLFAADIQTKGFIAHDTDDTIVLFEEKKSKYLENAVFIETSGLGHSMHSDELYKKSPNFYLIDLSFSKYTNLFSNFITSHF